jgi:hypothetical protein
MLVAHREVFHTKGSRIAKTISQNFEDFMAAEDMNLTATPL